IEQRTAGAEAPERIVVEREARTAPIGAPQGAFSDHLDLDHAALHRLPVVVEAARADAEAPHLGGGERPRGGGAHAPFHLAVDDRDLLLRPDAGPFDDET